MTSLLLGLAATIIGGTSDVSPLRVVVDDEDPRRLKVLFALPKEAGADRELRLTLRRLDERGNSGPPVFATRVRDGDDVVLTPRFRLSANSVYRVEAELDGKLWGRTHRTPADNSPSPTVTAVFPHNAVLPANCLKFYLHFSQPMRGGREIFDQIRIENERGEAVPDPWRRVELWSADYRRLTIWIHPGRVKQGVNLREDLGPVLTPEGGYRLVVDKSLRSAAGQPLGAHFVHRFRTGKEDRARPLPAAWRLSAPRAGSREPLEVDFREPLDHALLERMLRVTRGAKTVDGQGESLHDDTAWRFVPGAPWQAGRYRLEVDGRLEDTAGNTPLRVFDRDLREGDASEASLERAFEVSR